MIGAANPGDAFFIYVVFVVVFPVTMYAVMATLQLRAEETDGAAERSWPPRSTGHARQPAT